MTGHIYCLEKHAGMNTLHTCPECGKHKVFRLYINTGTKEHLNAKVGRCNREVRCGYHYTPKQYFADNSISFDKNSVSRFHVLRGRKQETIKPASFIPFEIFQKSRAAYDKNNFIQFLLSRFDASVVTRVIEKYHLASSKHWPGACIFWQIDAQGKVRTGKIMLYNPQTGKRVKEPRNYISWAHTALKQPSFVLAQCFFGEHLLIDRSKTVAIVESEKTAIIASIYFPDLIWLAVGSLQNLKKEMCKALAGRNVILFPDLKAFDKWSEKAKELSSLAKFTVSNLLELNATDGEREQGLDLADFLLKMNYREFVEAENLRKHEVQNLTKPDILENQQAPDLAKLSVLKRSPKREFELWDLSGVVSYFEANPPRHTELAFSKCSIITDLPKFVASHLETVKANNGNYHFRPYFDRLVRAKELLTNTPASAS